MRKHIEVVPYSPGWPRLFEREAEKIKEALGENCTAIHHVGSTSVPGLAAKPRIDIIAVVKTLEDTIEKLEKIGIQYKGEYNIPMHYGFSKRAAVDVNLHVYAEGNSEIELNLIFRDYLRNNPAVRDEYASLKTRLLSDDSSFEKDNALFTNYTLRKGAFIRKVLKEAGFDKVRILKCSEESEWEAAKKFRQKYFMEKTKSADPYAWTFNHPEHEHLILYQGAEIVGYAHIQRWPQARASVRMLVIDEATRNHGLGATFLKLCEQWLKSQGCGSLYVESSPAALRFFKKNGYVETPLDDPEGHGGVAGDVSIGKKL